MVDYLNLSHSFQGKFSKNDYYPLTYLAIILIYHYILISLSLSCSIFPQRLRSTFHLSLPPPLLVPDIIAPLLLISVLRQQDIETPQCPLQFHPESLRTISNDASDRSSLPLREFQFDRSVVLLVAFLSSSTGLSFLLDFFLLGPPGHSRFLLLTIRLYMSLSMLYLTYKLLMKEGQAWFKCQA